METIADSIINTGKFIDSRIIEYINKNGKKAYWEYVSRKGPGAVGCLVENIDTQSFVFVEQYRLPVQARVLELVAGVIDKNKSFEDIISEEISEETGYTAREIEAILQGPKSPGLSNEMSYDYYAQVQGKKGIQDLGESEDIQVIEIVKKDLFLTLEKKQKDGILISPGIYSSLLAYIYKKNPQALIDLICA